MRLSRRARSGRVLPLAVAVVAALVVPVLAAGSATAATDSDLSDVRVTKDALSATLILRSKAQTLTVDPKSVSVTIGGKDADVTVQPAASTARSTMLVIDTSGSMEASGMATVRTAVKEFLSEVPDDVKVGVVSFASTSGVDVRPTTDHAEVSREVGSLRSKGETALYEAIQDAVRGLGTDGERSIILLSDGGDTVARAQGGDNRERAERKKALEALSKAKVRAEVVSFKSADSNTEVLDQFAEAGGGLVVKASNTEAVSTAFSAAARALTSQAVLDIKRPAGVTGPKSVVVKGTASGETFEVTQRIDLGDTAPVEVEPDPTPTAEPIAAAGVPADTSPLNALSWSLLLPAIAVVFLGVFAFGLAVGAPAFRSRRSERIEAVEAYGFGRSTTGQKQAASTAVISEQLVHMGDQFMEGRESTTKTMALLTRADLPWRAGEWLVLRIIAIVVGFAVGLVLDSTYRFVGGAIGALLGLLLPPLLLRFLANRRGQKFEIVLPDVMMLVATSLSSGFSLLQALDSVAKDAPEPAAKEFSRALAEARIGSDVSDALDHMAVRMDSHNMRWTTMAIRIQREVGGNLAETLRTTAGTLREREMLRRQVKALSAEGRLSAYILIALPILLFFYSMWANYDYISMLWTNVLGWIMLAIGLVSLVIGIFWMRNVVKIEV
ncbi:type II secretion system F family protein [Phycicoccus flavus]|uniref:type II secretion system F family protein n=1 Tax=Phycicoccus flavus TaxID=2502783 RepID=UPI000FEB98D6|nr:type II secretion system F family protein [Phycicoccus flavus]NHA69173.1 VWA domain-containing protein [Phycicoccus flavus]